MRNILKKFEHINAKTVDEAVSALKQYEGKAKVIAGGTSQLDTMKRRILPDYPEALVNIKTIPGIDYIKEEGGILKIGALALLEDIANDAIVKANYAALAEAAHKVGVVSLRNMGTIGGNICQKVRCWYYRASDNRFKCLRKNPAGVCQALLGDNRYHSIFGAVNGCIAVNPSDIAPALVALDAKVVTSKRTVGIEEFMTGDGKETTILDDDELVTEIQVPEFSGKSAFLKFAIRKALAPANERVQGSDSKDIGEKDHIGL